MKIRYLLSAFLIVLVSIGTIPPASAQTGWYFGLGAGERENEISLSDIDDGSLISGSADDSDTGTKFFAGFLSAVDTNILSAVTSPLTLFALVILVCNAVVAVCAATLKNVEIVKYTIHMFIAIVFLIGSMILWTPVYFYPPQDVIRLNLPHNP